MPPIRVGLAGFGAWPRQTYVPILKSLPHVDVAAVAAPSEATRNLAAETFGPRAKLYSAYPQLLADDSIDAILMALPNPQHAGAVEAAIKAGKHVFFEPPIGVSAAQIDRTLTVVAGATPVVQADLELRYMPVIDAVTELVQRGTIGRLTMANVRLWSDWGHGGGEWKEAAEQDGFFLWLGCWYLDILDCVFRAPPLHARVTGGYAMNGRLMDHGWATLTYPHDRCGAFEFNLTAPRGLQIDLHVAGSEGEIEANLQAATYRWRTPDRDWQQSVAPPVQPVEAFGGMRESMTDFFDAIHEGRPARAGLEVCRRVHDAALICAEAEEKQRPRVGSRP